MLLQPHRALDNDPGGQSRRRILNAPTNAPGISFRALAAATGLPGGTIRHHLPCLERCGLITIARHGTRLFYFAGDEAPSPERLRYAVLHDLGPEWVALYEHVTANPGQRQKDLLDTMPDHSRSTVQHRLRRLVDLGLLQQRQVGSQGVAYLRSERLPDVAGFLVAAAPATPAYSRTYGKIMQGCCSYGCLPRSGESARWPTGGHTMAEKWKDKGENPELLNSLTLGLFNKVLGSDHTVEIEGEDHTVYVAPGQTVGDAISKGQFKDED